MDTNSDTLRIPSLSCCQLLLRAAELSNSVYWLRENWAELEGEVRHDRGEGLFGPQTATT